MELSHLSSLTRVFQHRSRPGHDYGSREIPPGREEIEVITEGRGFFAVRGALQDAGPGSALWYQGGERVIVTAHATEPYACTVFCFDVLCRNPHPAAPLSVWTELDACRRFCEDSLRLYYLGAAEEESFGLYLYSRLYWEAQRTVTAGARQPDPAALQRAVRFIEEHSARELDVADIAAAAGVSASHLHLLFRRHVGTSPMQTVLRHRIARARQLLVSTTLSIKEICHQCGFLTFSHFCRTFKKMVHVQPRVYREQHDYLGRPGSGDGDS